MKKESTAIRLKQIMEKRNLRQVDILEKCKPFCQKFDIKLGRNDLSQYVNGKVEPRQEKLTVLGLALNVSEAWLMGFDVPIERVASNKEVSPQIMQYYEMLNDIGKHEATKRVMELTEVPRYIKENTNYIEELESEKQSKIVALPSHLEVNAAHARTDIEIPEGIDTSDDDIMDDENF